MSKQARLHQQTTRDEYQIQQRTAAGWEDAVAEDSWREARERLREYRANQPEYPVRCIKRRVKLPIAPIAPIEVD